MGQIEYRKLNKKRYVQVKQVVENKFDTYKKQFFVGAIKGFDLIESLDKKYNEIMNDFSSLFKRR